MRILTLFFVLKFVFSASVFGQFSLHSFVSEPLNKNYASFREQLSDKKFEEKEILNFKAILYYDWLNPFSIKVGYLFNDAGKQLGKVIANGKESEEDAKKLFENLKTFLANKFGSDYSEQNMMGIVLVSWKDITDYSVILTKSENKTMLTILQKQ